MRGAVRSSERKIERLHSPVGRLDLECAIGYPILFAYQLVTPLTIERAVSLRIGILTVRSTRRLSVDPYFEPHRLPFGGRAHNQIHIVGVKAVRNASIRLGQHNRPVFHSPVSIEYPLIQCESWRDLVRRRCILDRIGCEAFRPLVSEIILR